MIARRVAGGVAVIIIATGLIWLSLANGVARVTSAQFPALGLRWMPWDARAQAGEAERILVEAKDVESVARAQELAREALRRDPTVVGAVRTIALTKQIGDRRAAERLMRYSTELSRRDLGTRLWLIERSVEEGDYRAALYHYDIALRTSRKAREVLTPILADAIAEHELIDPLVGRLANRPQWRPDFIRYLTYEGRRAKEASLLAQKLHAAGSPLDAVEVAALISRLVNEAHFEQAGRLFRQLIRQPMSRAWQVQNGDFERHDTATPFDWQLTSAYGLSARIEGRSGGGLALAYDQNIGEGGELGKQVLLLEPGAHNLSFTLGAVDGFSPGRLRVRIACATGAKQDLLKVEASSQSMDGERQSVSFNVPDSCRAQNLLLEGMPQGVLNGGWIDEVAIA